MNARPTASPVQPAPEEDFRALFEHAPISLWEEDYQALKEYLDGLRAQGIQDLRAHLARRPETVDECLARIRVVNVNRRTLELFEAPSRDALLQNLPLIFRDEMRRHFADELVDMWNGQLRYARDGINYTLSGKPLHIHLSWCVLPGSEATWARVLVAIEDVGARVLAEQALAESEAHFRGLFENSPISLWEEDYTDLKLALDRLRTEGVTDLDQHLSEHPEFVGECLAAIRVVDVNRRTLDLFGAASKAELVAGLDRIFRDEMRAHFRGELLDMWAGRLAYDREGINYSLTGDALQVHLHWSVLPGSEQTFARVLVAIEDATARKKAEDYLKYLGTHDALTKLYNRAYFEEELARLRHSRRYPISMLVADLDGLKQANDTLGHQAGDNLLRRAAEVLRKAFREEDVVARIGGDEFSVIMPETDALAAEQALERVLSMTGVNNTFYQGPALSMSLGVATGERERELADTLREADDHMYVAKRRHHKQFPRVPGTGDLSP
jgi:diguanylate cyclase (GGDEF)-like protein